MLAVAVLLPLLVGACTVLEWAGGITHARLEDSELASYLAAADASDRNRLGFSPLPKSGPVRVERPRDKRHYDVMLHIDEKKLSRTVDFLVRDGRPVWSGEQEIHYSGRMFETVDGQVAEHLVVSYSTVEGDGTPKGGYVSYWGPDGKLMEQKLTIADAQRIWRQWRP